MGERKFRGEAMQVRTPGGVIEVRWDKRGKATAMGRSEERRVGKECVP